MFPPAVIQGLDALPVTPLEFSRAWLARAEAVRRRRAELRATGALDGLDPWLAVNMDAALTGTLRVPVIPVRYKDVRAPFPHTVLEERLFGPGNGDTVSFAGYWDEVSGGLLRVEGRVMPWVELKRPARHYLPSAQYGWSQFGRMSEIWSEVVKAAEHDMDLGAFDNDGPDGVPNSGDDDGFVDFVVIVYATDCRGDWRAGSIWPHRGAMPPVETRHERKGGGRIRMADYVILPAIEPGTCDPMNVGVLAHETGHALGLPDLYDYDGTSQGIGAWGLMGTGSQSAPHSPAHLSAWAKEQLGWVQVDWLHGSAADVAIPPVASYRRVLRYDIPGSNGEYVLLENRQRVGSDQHLPGNGLLVWRIDPEQGELGTWNSDERRPTVGLIQADGREDLRRGLPADAGDPFPGATGNDELAVGDARPLRLSRIRETEGLILVDVEIQRDAPPVAASPDRASFSVVASQGPVEQLIRMQSRDESGTWSLAEGGRASWLTVSRKGEVVLVRVDPAGLQPDTYRETIRILGGEGSMALEIPVELTVVPPGSPEVLATRLPWSWGLAAVDGGLIKASYAWDPLGMRPQSRLLRLRPGESHPGTLARLPAEALYSPVPTGDGAIYVLAHANGENYLYRVEPDGSARVMAHRFGDAPAYGLATLPDHSAVVADWSGNLHRVAADGAIEPWGRLGTNVYQIATDPRGTLFAATYGGQVIRISPSGDVSFLPTGFHAGRLVAVAAAEDGSVYAAERGGEGRIVRIPTQGAAQTVARVPGAHFYGLAVEGDFLYALDLHGRSMLRIGLTPTPTPRRAVADDD